MTVTQLQLRSLMAIATGTSAACCKLPRDTFIA
jgi:hypothetical protein